MVDSDSNIEELVTDCISGQASPEKERLLASLLKKDEEKRRLFAEFAKVRALAAIPYFTAGKKENFTRLRPHFAGHSLGMRIHRGFPFFLKIAAAVMLFFSINGMVLYLYVNKLEEKHNVDVEYCSSAPLGSVCNVVLPDGTEVMLNAGSSLRYHSTFGQEDRQVFLNGEGYFKVKQDLHTPFCVNSKNACVRVTGTVFNIKDYENETHTKVVLQNGHVDVKFRQADTMMTTSLEPHEVVVCDNRTGKLVRSFSDADKQTGWVSRKFYFSNTAFPEMAREFERKYNVQIVIKSKRLMQEYFSGSFDYDYTINDILREVDIDKKYVWQRNDNVIVVKDRG